MAVSLLVRRDIFHPILVAVKQQSQAAPWRARLAWLLLGLTALLAVVELPLWPAYHDWFIAHYDLAYSAGVSMLFAALEGLSWISLALLGTLIIFAQPENRIGWLLLSAVLIVRLVELCATYAVYAYVIALERQLPLRELALWIQHWVWIPPLMLMLIALPLLFPNGRLPSRRWKWFALWAVGMTGLLSFLVAFHPDMEIANVFLDIENDPPNPYSIAALPRFLGLLIIPLWILSLLTMLVACLSLVVRYRQIDITTRQQIKWFVFWAVMLIVFSVVRGLLEPVLSPGVARLMDIVSAVGSNCLPIILGISIFKFRLYDIDLVINRTLVYSSLTALIVGIYVLIVGALGALFQSGGGLLISLVATGTVAVLFQPLRERLQRAVNRLMFGERDDPVAVLSRLGQRLETMLSPQAVLPGIVEIVAQALKLPYVAVEVRRDQDFVMAAAYGLPVPDAIRFPLIYQADTIGQLVVASRAPGEVFSSEDRHLLENVAHQAGAAVHRYG